MSKRTVSLCLGSVTARQYEPYRLELMRKDIVPRIVRVPDVITYDETGMDIEETGSYFGLSQAEVIGVDEDGSEWPEEMVTDVYQLVRDYIDREVVPLDEVFTVVAGCVAGQECLVEEANDEFDSVNNTAKRLFGRTSIRVRSVHDDK